MRKYRVRETLHEDLITHLLLARGIEAEEHANFLEPDFERDSGDPFLLPDMEKAVERVVAAVRGGEKVCVWSDYDGDGIPGGVMLAQFLRRIGLYVRHYIPHRHEEGYGLNNKGLEELANEGVTLVITVDLGTTDAEPIAFARSRGIDVIVTDHHLVSGPLPQDAFAVINPKRPDSVYPFDGLCGAGVAWKLVQGILARERFDVAVGQEKWMLDLVGLATLSDMVPLRGENRMLASFGLLVMRRGRRPGLASLLSLLKIKPSTLTEDDVGFMVTPRINAASRMGDPSVAARMLAAEQQEEAREFARALQALNDERKSAVATTVKEIKRRVSKSEALAHSITVMGNPNWRPGILGLVANSLAEQTKAPVFLWGREGGELLRGSCRSGGAVNVVELMKEAADVFEDFGGHKFSGGFSLRQERVHELHSRLTAAYEKLRAQEVQEEEVVLDRRLDLVEASHALKGLMKLAPFGAGFEKPKFLFVNVSIASVRTFGKANDHLALALLQGSAHLEGVSFFSSADSFDKKISAGERVDIVGHIELDWRGNPRVRVVDVL